MPLSRDEIEKKANEILKGFYERASDISVSDKAKIEARVKILEKMLVRIGGKTKRKFKK